MIDLLEIGEIVKKPVRNLSLGERMKCEIAGSLLHQPRVLFLDEPTIGLDVAMQRRIRAFVAEYNRRSGATILLTSHYMADVEALCRRVIVIHHGTLLYDGELPGLVQRFSPLKTIAVEFEEGVDLDEAALQVIVGQGRRSRLGQPGRRHHPRAQKRDGAGHRRAAGERPGCRPDRRGSSDRRGDRAGLRRRFTIRPARTPRRTSRWRRPRRCRSDGDLPFVRGQHWRHAPRQGASRISPRALLDYYVAKFQAEIAVQFAYRGAIFIWLISLVTTPLISLVVWTTVARENGGSAGGFTSGEYAAYFIAVMIVNNLTFTWIMWEMEYRVKNGMFSPVLLRPIHPIHNDVVTNLTFKLLTSIAMVPIAIALAIRVRRGVRHDGLARARLRPDLALRHVPPVRLRMDRQPGRLLDHPDEHAQSSVRHD